MIDALFGLALKIRWINRFVANLLLKTVNSVVAVRKI